MSKPSVDKELRLMRNIWGSVTKNWAQLGPSGRSWLKEKLKDLPIEDDKVKEQFDEDS